MNRILPTLLLFLITCTLTAQTDWQLLNPTPSHQPGLDVHFISSGNGFAITTSELLFTEDSGRTWKEKMKLQSAADIHFLGDTGYIVGYGGYVLASKDAGGTWAQVKTGSTENLNSVQIIDEKTIILSGSKSIVRSDDGGVTWESHEVGGNYTINKTFFTSGLTGHAVCQGGFILKTVDGGQNWSVTESTNIYPNNFFTVHFASEKIGFATKEHNAILKTTDGGETWNKTGSTSDALYSFFFLNEKEGFAAGEHGAVYRTEDGGNTWKWISFQNGRISGTSIHGIYFHNSTDGYLVGDRGMIFKTTNGGSSWEQYSPFYHDVKQLQLVTEDIGYASVFSSLFKTTDGGATWEDMGSPHEGAGIGQFEFLNEKLGYATVGIHNYMYSVYKTVDGGKSWEQTNNGFEIMRDNLYSLEFLNDKTGFVSGGYNQKGVFKTTDGGDSWIIVGGFSFGEMQFVDETTGYAREVGHYLQKIYKTTDAGENWEPVLETEDRLTSIYFVDKEVGYVAGEYGVMHKTTDGGASWKKLDVPYLNYKDINFYFPNVGYALDDNGGIWKTVDGAFSWDRTGAINQITSINITEGQQIYLAGKYGKILKSTVSFAPYSLTAAPAEEVMNNSALLVGNASANTGSITDLEFHFGTDNKYDKVLSVTPGTVETHKSVGLSVEAKGLLPATRYQYRIRGISGGQYIYSQRMEFTTTPDYELRINPPYLQMSNNVRLSGMVVANKADISEIEFQYGTEDDNFSKSVSASPASVSTNNFSDVKATLNELAPDTEYLMRIKAVHEGKLIYSEVKKFKTYPEYSINLYAARVTENDVAFSAYVSSFGKDIKNLVFEYGTKEFEDEVGAEPNEVLGAGSRSISSEVKDLDPEQTYYYRVRGTIDDKNIYSSVGVFNMTGTSVVVPDGVTTKKAGTITFQGLINPNGKYITGIRFEYGIDEQFDVSVPAAPATLNGVRTTVVKAELNDLIPGSTYSFRIKADSGEQELVSDPYKFTTAEAVQIGQDVLSLQVMNETCDGKTNGSLFITSEEEHDFSVIINGEEYEFTSELLLENLAPGNYTACITASSAPEFLQCFEFNVAAGKSLSANAQMQKSTFGYSASISMNEGTAPFLLRLNGNLVGEYDSPDFSVEVRHGDELEISSGAACEGKVALTVDLDESITAYPNPASSVLNILLPFPQEKAVQVDIYTNSGSRLTSGKYEINDGVVTLPLEDLVSGIYFAVVRLKSPKTIKFSKQ